MITPKRSIGLLFGQLDKPALLVGYLSPAVDIPHFFQKRNSETDPAFLEAAEFSKPFDDDTVGLRNDVDYPHLICSSRLARRLEDLL